MQQDNLFSVLSSEVRIEILKLLSHSSASVKEVLTKLQTNKIEIKYRESVYRDLEKLVEAGLVKKYYDNKHKGIRYGLLITQIQFNLCTGEIVKTSNKETEDK